MFIYQQFLLIEKPNTINIWLEAESHPTNGFRKAWHCTLEPIAPHFKNK
jgi:hypothetical protein